MRFAYPYFLFFLIVLIGVLVSVLKNKYKQKDSYINYSDVSPFKFYYKQHLHFNYAKVLSVLRILVMVLLVLAAARPQSGKKGEEVITKGHDIIICLDTSSSMKAEDFKPNNRLYVAKQVVKDFIKGRKYDRIGVVVFSAIAFTQAPLTTDYNALLEFLNKVEIGMTQTDGTAIGTAILTCVNRLKKSKAKNKIIILLTDGRSNMGEVDPITASHAADSLGIKIYTIGVGVPGGALFPIDHPVFGKQYVKIKEDLDEDTLNKIANSTDGQYFRAKDEKSLVSIYKMIDKLEKTDIKVKEYTRYKELYRWFLFPGFILLLLDIFLRYFLWSKIP